MKRTKSILLAATALAMFTAPQLANAQTVASGVTFIAPPATPSANRDMFPDSYITVTGITADGSTVLADPSTPSNSPNALITNQARNIWVWDNGIPRTIAINRPTLANGEVSGFYFSNRISGDGKTITGRFVNAFPGTSQRPAVIRPVYWTQATGINYFPDISATEIALGNAYVNTNGSYFAVTSRLFPYLSDGTPNPLRLTTPGKVFRYSPTDGYLSVGSLGATINMVATGISGAGNVIFGTAHDLSAANIDVNGNPISLGGFRWDSSAGLSRLPDLSAAPLGGTLATYSEAGGISRDGSTIVGLSRGSDGRFQATYWRSDGIHALGYLPGLASPTTTDIAATGVTTALRASADGSIIVGSAIGGSGGLAWRWTAAEGMQNLNLLASNAGLNLNGFVLNDALGISDSGQYITGSARKGALDAFGTPAEQQGYVLSIAAAPVVGLNFLAAPAGSDAGTNTSVRGITADGTQVSGSNLNIPVVWRNGVPVSFSPGFLYINERISGNGLAMSGFNPDSPDRNAIVWTAGTGAFLIANRSAREIATGSAAIDSTGTYFAVNTGTYDPGSTAINRIRSAYRYTMAGGYQSIGSFGATWGMQGNGISGDGSIIVGEADDLSIPQPLDFTGVPAGQPGIALPVFDRAAFRWSETGGMSRLVDLSAAPVGGTVRSHSIASGISRDGTTIVGESRGSTGQVQAVYWRGSAINSLGFLPGVAAPTGTGTNAAGATHALAANLDGSVIVGRASTATLDRAWRWTASGGMQDLNVFAANAGINLGGYVLTDAVGLSDNGEVVTGNSTDGTQFRGYVFQIARVAAPTTLSTTARLIVTLTLPGVTQTSIVNQTFSTQVDARLNGTTVFTRTVGDQIAGSLGVTALADARTSLQQTSGLRRVVIGAPVLISNTTTVQSSTSNTVNVASGTQVTTAAVVTNGPATVATGDLGICARAASDGINPTGCSLPGTPVTVNANVINTNTFTNTINSVTPTTTTTVNQLVSAKWQVSATAGNQFGTVHALVGPVAFERGDRLIGQLIDMGGAGGAAPVTRAAVGGSGLTMFGGYFGNWASIDADSRVPVASVRGNTDGFVLGLEKTLGDARIGVAVDHGTSDYTVRDATCPEALSMKHAQVGLFANWKSGGFSLDGAAAYGFGTVRTTLTTPTTPATATRDVRSWSVGAQAGYGFDVDATRVTLVAGVRHTSAKLDAFTETGGPTPLSGLSKTVTRTRLYGGVEVATRLDLGGVTITPRVHARAASDSGDASGVADLVFVSAPNGPVMQAVGPGVGRTVAELGGSLDAAVGGNVHLWAGYDGSFRSGARSHAAKAGVTVAF
ncbi:autotransporter domain-containing protein [Sphingomonas sp. SUN039]|uniref:autotransporter domain-containing protein n=1 Tax=Sphingomonas sp. SUN039 TaxID=2937787 RepID=UPI00216477ED|nr:autotransporter domain-containing protein [Sphingomonas sp. SUN039]UVO53568.1 autotransporter domain-containing protein [Sphingomonas sp. SUN039]